MQGWCKDADRHWIGIPKEGGDAATGTADLSFANPRHLAFVFAVNGPPTAMKPNISADDSRALPKETPARKAARRRKLHAILKKGMGMSPQELKDSLWPGYAETYRSDRKFTVTEPKAPYGKRRAR